MQIFEMKTLKIFLSETTLPGALIFCRQHLLVVATKQISDYDKEMPQSHTTDQPMVLQGKDTEHRHPHDSMNIFEVKQPDLEVINLFFMLMKFILLINVKMPTIVGLLTFISRINASYESLHARNTHLFQRFCFYEQLKFYAQFS